ncbi:uncharacterized protein LOC144159348 [Haemaphysalis longicornis]
MDGTKPSKFAGINWDNTPLEYLGVPLHQISNSGQHWSSALTHVKRTSQAWMGRELSVFARAQVFNVFLVANLVYVLQVLHCARAKVQALHRAFAIFVWGSEWEPRRKDNLFLPLGSGGVGLVHLFVHQLVSGFFFYQLAEHPLLRTILQERIRYHLPFLLFSTGKVNKKPPWGFLKEVEDTFHFLTARFSLEYLFSLSRKVMTKTLIHNLSPVPLYRQPYLRYHKNNVLDRVKRMCVPPNAKTFFFKLHSQTLPVKTWLREKGMLIPWSDNCRLCNQPETIDHCFVLCRDTVFFWDVLQRTLKKDIDLTPYTIRFLPFEDANRVPYDVFVLLGLFSLWNPLRRPKGPLTSKYELVNACSYY